MAAATTSIIGFDSAWVDKPTAPGAVCSIRLTEGGRREFVEPQLASFAQALEFIREEQRHSERCLVALDQPTIVPNAPSCRPVDRVAGSLISWLGGGVQPANTSKTGGPTRLSLSGRIRTWLIQVSPILPGSDQGSTRKHRASRPASDRLPWPLWVAAFHASQRREDSYHFRELFYAGAP